MYVYSYTYINQIITYSGYLEVSLPYPPVTFCFCPVLHGGRLKYWLSKQRVAKHQTKHTKWLSPEGVIIGSKLYRQLSLLLYFISLGNEKTAKCNYFNYLTYLQSTSMQ